MNEFPHEQPADDKSANRAWQELVDRSDLLGTDDPAQLAAAEALLAEADLQEARDGHLLEPIAADWIDRTIAKATERPARSKVFRLRRWALVAATLMLASMLTAAVAVIWSAGQRSISGGTMTYDMAIRLIQRSDQVEKQRRSAMAFTMQRVLMGIDTLNAVAGDPMNPPSLAQTARDQLDQLLALVDSSAAVRTVWDDDLVACQAVVRDQSRSPAERESELHRLAGMAATGIVALRDMPEPGKVLEPGRRLYLDAIRTLLRQ